MLYKVNITLLYIITGYILLSGLAITQAASIRRNAEAKLQRKPVIRIAGENAHIHIFLPLAVTRLKIKNCIRATSKCRTDDVSVPRDRRLDKDAELRDFTTVVKLVDTHRHHLWTFYIWKYAGDALLSAQTETINVSCCQHDPIILTLLAAFVTIIIMIILLVLIREIGRARRAAKNRKRRKRGLKDDPEKPDPDKGASRKVELRLCPSILNQIRPSDIILESMLHDGHYYQIWKGNFIDERCLNQGIVIKRDKGCNEGYIRYLIRQGENMMKLKTNEHIISCLGMTPDYNSLILEAAPHGNLKQYLKARAGEKSSGLTVFPSFAIDFINQIIAGVSAVHGLNPTCLFYCLSATNVLVFGDRKCKLSGFANFTLVRHREDWEEKNKLPRPIQWLSPEAIALQHVLKSDIWSLGILMWEIFSEGKDPYGNLTAAEVRQKIVNGEKLLIPPKCTQEVFDIMALCWMHDPNNRPSLNYISHSLMNINC